MTVDRCSFYSLSDCYSIERPLALGFRTMIVHGGTLLSLVVMHMNFHIVSLCVEHRSVCPSVSIVLLVTNVSRFSHLHR